MQLAYMPLKQPISLLDMAITDLHDLLEKNISRKTLSQIDGLVSLRGFPPFYYTKAEFLIHVSVEAQLNIR